MLTLSSINRRKRQSKKRENLMPPSLQTSTPIKKSKNVHNILETQNERSFDLSHSSIDFIQEFENNGNDKGVQCDLGCESVDKYLLKTNNELSFELSEDVSEEESDEENDKDIKDSNLISKPNIDSDACFIIFWENILCLFKYLSRMFSNKYIYETLFLGSFLSVITVCNEGHTVQCKK